MPWSDIKVELVVCVLSAEKEEHLYTKWNISFSQSALTVEQVTYHIWIIDTTIRASLGSFEIIMNTNTGEVKFLRIVTISRYWARWLSFIFVCLLLWHTKTNVPESSQVEKIVTVTVVVREQHIWHERHPVWSELPAPAPLETSVHSLSSCPVDKPSLLN